MRSSVRLLVYALFLTSGATALVYQIAWTRNLSLIFGTSCQAVSIVLNDRQFDSRWGCVRPPERGVCKFLSVLPNSGECVEADPARCL